MIQCRGTALIVDRRTGFRANREFRNTECCHTGTSFRATSFAYESRIGRQDKVQIGGEPGPGSFIMRFGFD